MITRYCGPRVIAGSHFCAYAQGQLVGAANLINHPLFSHSPDAYLTHVGVVGIDHPNAYELTGALIWDALGFAAERSLKVWFEADNTYTPHYALFEKAPATEVDRDLMLMMNG